MGTYWWAGNWWQGSVSSPVTGVPLEEQIRELVAAKLATITIANGYNQNATVHRPPVAVMDLGAADCPALSLRTSRRNLRPHLRGAEEFLLEVDVLCAVANTSAPASDEALAKLMADVRHLVYANPRWHDGSKFLAVKSWIPEDRVHETEVLEATISSFVRFIIKARSSQSDLTAVKDV